MFPLAESEFSRRFFFGAMTTAMSMLALPAVTAEKRLQIVGFIKPFQKHEPERIAEIARELGWNGIELPVRRGGSIEPQNVEDQLPTFAESLRQANVELSIIATDVEDPNETISQRVLRTAKKLGISRYRTKHSRYDLTRPIAPQVDRFRGLVRELAALNKEIGIQGGIQNHSGANYVGAPVWDIWDMLREIDPKHLGIYFDIAHATIEGGLSWPLEAKLVQPHLAAVSVKDFVWSKLPRGKWDAAWRPLGEGMVNPDFFKRLREGDFSGPISMHFEYELGSEDQMIAALRKDTQTLRQWLA